MISQVSIEPSFTPDESAKLIIEFDGSFATQTCEIASLLYEAELIQSYCNATGIGAVFADTLQRELDALQGDDADPESDGWFHVVPTYPTAPPAPGKLRVLPGGQA